MKAPILLLFLLLSFPSMANEGMWVPSQLNEQTRQLMKELGLQLPATLVYSETHPSMKDAVVNFGGFCSGVVVSADGLVFTNHHCGFESIARHSTVENDYLRDGFVAWTKEEELPDPELYVSFLVRTEDVTARILSAVFDEMGESERIAAIDSVTIAIENEGYERDSLLRHVVSSHYGGSEFMLSSYQDFNDVRLVYAPPSSVGKFGGDTDNWVWPRHTGDFSVFRIYADTDNRPAEYSSANVPYQPVYAIPISLQGFRPGSFCMTMGYPGETSRYLSSFGVEERMETANAAMIDVRGIKQSIWKEAMERDNSIRIKYATKYAVSSNYWKNSIGMNQAIDQLNVIGRKRAIEKELMNWIRQQPEERNRYLQILTELGLHYRNRRSAGRASSFFVETFLNSSELIMLAFEVVNFDGANDSLSVARERRRLKEVHANIDLSIDKKVLTAVLTNYYNKVDSVYLPEAYTIIREEWGGDISRYVDHLYATSLLSTPEGLDRLLQGDASSAVYDDPATALVLDLLVKLYDFNYLTHDARMGIEKNERLLTAALREMQTDRPYYPDADFSLRMSIGMVGGYSPQNGVNYSHYTTTRGIFEKVAQHLGDSDFDVQPSLLALLAERDFGNYAHSTDEMSVCFISDNDITGGNSGSGMFDSQGRLIGLAFDGNWEAMSSDLLFEPRYQRCVGVDIRYVLYIMDKYSGARHLIDELIVVPGE